MGLLFSRLDRTMVQHFGWFIERLLKLKRFNKISTASSQRVMLALCLLDFRLFHHTTANVFDDNFWSFFNWILISNIRWFFSFFLFFKLIDDLAVKIHDRNNNYLTNKQKINIKSLIWMLENVLGINSWVIYFVLVSSWFSISFYTTDAQSLPHRNDLYGIFCLISFLTIQRWDVFLRCHLYRH